MRAIQTLRLTLGLTMGMMLSVSAFAGGVSGGGGNTLTPQPVSTKEIKDTIAKARRYVEAYFNDLERYETYPHIWGDFSDLPRKLFRGAKQASDWAIDLPIYLEQNGPCLDDQGQAVDGSTTLDPPQVCLSMPRLQQKLSHESFRVQILALIVHECSHLVGTTEPEAEFLQAKAQNDLISAEFIRLDGTFQGIGMAISELHSYALYQFAVPTPITSAVWQRFQEKFSDLNKEFLENVRNNWSEAVNLNPWSKHIRERTNITYYRLELMRLAACAFGQGEHAERCKADLDQYFNGTEEVRYHDLMINTGVFHEGDFINYDGVVFRRIRNETDLGVEMVRFGVELQFWEGLIDKLHD